MRDESCVAIKDVKEIPLFGNGDSVGTRLRNVGLREFPDVRIYENATFELEWIPAAEIPRRLHTPQPSLYQPNLDRVGNLREMFKREGVDILRLDKGYDFTAVSSSGEERTWTIIPPVVERMHIPNVDGKLSYGALIGPRLRGKMEEWEKGLNPDVTRVPHTSHDGWFDLINDGSHRIHFGFLNEGIQVLRVSGMTTGFPYYAAPQPYSSVEVYPEPNPETTGLKVHILEEPAQKGLYRNFPSAGILSGGVRPPTKGEEFI